jgi:hypothetical protein
VIINKDELFMHVALVNDYHTPVPQSFLNVAGDRDRLAEAAEEAEVRTRHRAWFMALAEQSELELRGPRQAIWLDRLGTEHDNLGAALAWGRDDPGENAFASNSRLPFRTMRQVRCRDRISSEAVRTPA